MLHVFFEKKGGQMMSFASRVFIIFSFSLIGLGTSAYLGMRVIQEYGNHPMSLMVSLGIIILWIMAIPNFKKRYLV